MTDVVPSNRILRPHNHTVRRSFLNLAGPAVEDFVDISSQQRAAEAEFDVLWSEGNVTGWSDVNKDKQNGVNDAEGIWCSACEYDNCLH